MLPGFSFLLGLGSLFVAACWPPAQKPGNTKQDWDNFYMTEQLKKWDAETIEGSGYKIRIYAPLDYPPAIEAGKDPMRPSWKREYNCPLGWDEFAMYYKTSMAEARCEYFRWRCEKEGVYFYFPAAWRYCNSFGPRHQKRMG